MTLVEDLDTLADALARPEPEVERREAGAGLASDLRTYLEQIVS